MQQIISEYIQNLTNTLQQLHIGEIEAVANVFLKAREEGKTIYTFGNGGSGSTASHMVCDIVKGVSYQKEKKFKMVCLNDNIPIMLAYSNDVSYNEVFVEQLKNFLQPGDVVLGISGSGNSENIIKAIEYANSKGNTTIGFTGFNGGKLKKLATLSFNANYNCMQVSEDVHLVALHILYKVLDKA